MKTKVEPPVVDPNHITTKEAKEALRIAEALLNGRRNTSDNAAMESTYPKMVQCYEILKDLVESLPKCTHTRGCDTPATAAFGRGGPRYCDRHNAAVAPEYPRAPAVRKALAILGKAT